MGICSYTCLTFATISPHTTNQPRRIPAQGASETPRMMNTERCMIDPALRDARVAASWLFSQGDMRGFLCEPGTEAEYLIVFDSYGATHHSASLALGKTRGDDWIALIFRTDGTVYVELSNPPREFSALGSEKTCKFITALYAAKAMTPRWVNW